MPDTTISKEARSLVHGIFRKRSEGKAAYAKAKEYQAKLQTLAGVGTAVLLEDGRKFAVVDTFTGDAEQVRKMTIIDRFELQEVK